MHKNNCQNYENKNYGKKQTFVEKYTPMWQIWQMYLDLRAQDCKNESDLFLTVE